ncbi:hypothetical protein L6452_21384 [Arctium lappa]|uniref:Uncharacterized protein n=1 Tax=Arctium lappa TaxID=4217 RepID=A0ACB9BF98_ARCLA|nr:hypothetical protein L6452_21384 [Arctium lappa]
MEMLFIFLHALFIGGVEDGVVEDVCWRCLVKVEMHRKKVEDEGIYPSIHKKKEVVNEFINMKDLSFLLLKNSLGFKMKKGFKNLCSGDGSTSTLNQQNNPDHPHPHPHPNPTLEEMIMHLDLEEKMARRAKLEEYGEVHHRMSCVNSSDILRSARNALNQYPRFSLDGKDAMYRSSFRNFDHVTNRNSIDHGHWIGLPAKVAGERVVWCKPGVVGKLMGLEAMPIPVRLNHRINSCILRKQNLRRRSSEMERRKLDSNRTCRLGSCSKPTTGYHVLKPTPVEIARDEVGWPMRRFL